MKGLGQKSIFGIWVLSLLLSSTHIVSMVLIPEYLNLIAKWIASSLGILPVIISTGVYYKMRADLEKNHVQPFIDENPETRRINVLRSEHQPFKRREADSIFAGRSAIEIVVSR